MKQRMDRALRHPGCAALSVQVMRFCLPPRRSGWSAPSMRNLPFSSPRIFRSVTSLHLLDGGVPFWRGCVAGWNIRSVMKGPARSPSCFSSVKATAAPFPSRSWLGEPVFPICSPFQGCIFQCFWVLARLFVPCFSVPTGRSGRGWSFPVCLCSSPVPNLPWSELLGWPSAP